ncbi:MAG: tRNA lysidine(34) synthetase TilS [Bacteriovoracia bacterium]
MNNGEKILAKLREAFRGLGQNARKCLAISGGIDSMLLLEAAHRIGAENVLVLHVNHGLRGEESAADELFVRRVAQAYGFRYESILLSWADEKPSQAACRKRREDFFESVLRPGEKIFLAHHRDDQAETVFLRLLRGTGIDGLGGMAEESANKIRPLLGFSREEILAAAKAWKVTWREDSSNRSSRYERNWLRNEIFPLLEARRPGFSRRLADLAGEVGALETGKGGEANLFSFAPGLSFGERGSLLALGERGIKNTFRLNRRHTLDLARLLKKGSGECSSEGKKFRLSQGILLVESGERFCDRLDWRSPRAGENVAESMLGAWTFRSPLNETLAAPDLLAGEKGKKRFQEEGVPIFFRASLPVLRAERGKKILLPLLPGSTAFLDFCPSSLGHWWLNSSAARGDRAGKISR